jgi:hypothetical protein
MPLSQPGGWLAHWEEVVLVWMWEVVYEALAGGVWWEFRWKGECKQLWTAVGVSTTLYPPIVNLIKLS